MSVSSIIGPGLLIGAFTLFILAGFALSFLENRLAPTREH
jgi:hypothetical protein